MRIASKSRSLPIAVLMVLVAACGGEGSPTAPLPDLGGVWTGANAVAAVDVTLSNISKGAYCAELMIFCSGHDDTEYVRLRGTYRHVPSGEVIELVSYAQRRRDRLVAFDLFQRDDFATEPERPTYAKTRLVGQLTDEGTIEATIFTEYQQSSGGSSVTWTTWSADSSAIALHRR